MKWHDLNKYHCWSFEDDCIQGGQGRKEVWVGVCGVGVCVCGCVCVWEGVWVWMWVGGGGGEVSL